MRAIGHRHAAGSSNVLSNGTVAVAIDELNGPVVPRIDGVDERHARLLSESFPDLPPILVQRRTLRVIDGMHRVLAAELLGEDQVQARFFDGDDDDAFLRGVAENVSHGLPLSLADRRAAAGRILTSRPEWSDRRIARLVGLSGKTVGALRDDDRAGARADRRQGSDGRFRPVDGVAGRRRAAQLLHENPTSSLREIASAANVSPSTVRDVRQRLSRRTPPVTDTQLRAVDGARTARTTGTPRSGCQGDEVDRGELLGQLRRDPAVRSTDVGRTVLRSLHHQPAVRIGVDVIAALPSHCLPIVARLARSYAAHWEQVARTTELLANRAQVD